MSQSFRELSDEYFQRKHGGSGGTPESVAETPLEKALVTLERNEDLEERVTDMTNREEVGHDAELDEGAAPDKPAPQNTEDAVEMERPVAEVDSPPPVVVPEEETVDVSSVDGIAERIGAVDVATIETPADTPPTPIEQADVATTAAVDISIETVERPDAPRVPKPSGSLLDVTNPQEFVEPDVRLESEEVSTEFHPGIQKTTILPDPAIFDAKSLLDELDQKSLNIPEYASEQSNSVPSLDPMPDVNVMMPNAADKDLIAHSQQIANWERR